MLLFSITLTHRRCDDQCSRKRVQLKKTWKVMFFGFWKKT